MSSYARQHDSASASFWADPDAAPEGQLKSEGRGRLRAVGPCNDAPWILLWIAQMIVVCALGFTYYQKYKDDMSSTSDAVTRSGRVAPSINMASLNVVFLSIAVAVSVSLGFLLMVKKFTREFIQLSLVAVGILIAALIGVCIYNKQWVGCALNILFLGIWIWYAYSVQDAIPFATAVLETVIHALSLWPSLIFVTLTGMIGQVVWFLTWCILALSCLASMSIEFEKGRPASSSNSDPNAKVLTAKLAFALFGLLLSFFWTSQVIKNVVHMTVSGVVATWYFLFPNSMPEGSPVTASLGRACTSSFGTIVLGSLVTAFVKALRTTFHLMVSIISEN